MRWQLLCFLVVLASCSSSDPVSQGPESDSSQFSETNSDTATEETTADAGDDSAADATTDSANDTGAVVTDSSSDSGAIDTSTPPDSASDAATDTRPSMLVACHLGMRSGLDGGTYPAETVYGCNGSIGNATTGPWPGLVAITWGGGGDNLCRPDEAFPAYSYKVARNCPTGSTCTVEYRNGTSSSGTPIYGPKDASDTTHFAYGVCE